MSYAAKFLQTCGQQCTVLRSPPIRGYVSLKRASRSAANPGTREAYWEGLISTPGLASGEIVQIGAGKYLTLSADTEPSSGETVVLLAKTNTMLSHKRKKETVDNNGNIIEEWKVLKAEVPAFGQIVTAELRQVDSGLLSNTRYVAQVAKSIGALEMDRMVYNGTNYQVESIDDVALAGVARLQLGADTRA